MTTDTKKGLNGLAWFLLGIPAIAGWIVYGVAWLLVARFPEIGDPLNWAFLIMGWYYIAVAGLLLIVFVIGSGGILWI